MFRLDLHTHTLHSGDSGAEPRAMVEAAIEKGLQGIAFTEHYYYGASEHAEGLRQEYAGRIRIFRGVEFSAAEGHCLVFGVDTDRLGVSGCTVKELVREVSARGGVVIPSHPYRRGTGMGDLVMSMQGIAAIEGCNGFNMHAMNLSALDAAKRLGLPVTGGSDAHAPVEVGHCLTEFEQDVPEDGLVEAILCGRYRALDNRRISRLLHAPGHLPGTH